MSDVLVVVALVAVPLAALWQLSPGTVTPYLDERGVPLRGSVSDKARISVNGVDLGMFIRGRDRTRPVLLFLHGGPGMPEYFLERTRPSNLEDDFVVCWWEQRGAGMSYHPAMPHQSMSVDQLISDTVEVTNYLRERFDQDKIYLLGHSWGTFLGIQVAARRPDLYHAYVGMGQITHQIRSEILFHRYAITQFEQIGDTRMARKLRRAPVTTTLPLPRSYLKLRDTAMHRLGVGTTRDMTSAISGIFIPVWATRDYTMREKIAIGLGKAYSQRRLWNTFLATDLTAIVPRSEIPIYICQGRFDYTVNSSQARSYLARLSAPVKGFYTFDSAAHSPLWEQPERMRRILREDVLTGQTTLADDERG
ncbi:MAG: alpha/beta hydrolase [Dactylosporangium sp.]|nr:alpha/beta hydrolase [Dactylosporangium sp.]NNJ62640.1 alpha/beta hydrolase [Dactylosporangium sp.]